MENGTTVESTICNIIEQEDKTPQIGPMMYSRDGLERAIRAAYGAGKKAGGKNDQNIPG